MSADNTILVVKRNDVFKVAHVSAAESITEDQDEEIYNMLYANAPEFLFLEDAISFAEDIEKEYGYVEYGIRYFVWNEEK